MCGGQFLSMPSLISQLTFKVTLNTRLNVSFSQPLSSNLGGAAGALFFGGTGDAAGGSTGLLGV